MKGQSATNKTTEKRSSQMSVRKENNKRRKGMRRMMPRLVSLLSAAAFFAFSGATLAGQLDILLDILTEKGVITAAQAQQIRSEVKEEGKKEISEGMAETLSNIVRESKFKGDLRVRFQHDETDTGVPDTTTRDRGRIRVRYGFDTPVNDTVKAGLHLASGVGEQTSTNQTFTNTFNQKQIWIDKAYLTWTPTPRLSFTAGKFANPFFTTDLIWDSDINPEGAAFTGQLPLSKEEGAPSVWTVAALCPLYEASGNTSDDPLLWALQVGADFPRFWNARLGLAWYNTANLKGAVVATVAPSYTGSGNTLSGGAFTMDYRMLSLSTQFTPYTFNVCPSGLPLTFYGQHVRNTSSQATEDTGYIYGFRLGNVKQKGDLQFEYNYRVIEQDAVLQTLADSDFHGGGTDGKGHKIGFGLGLSKNTSLNLTYFLTEKESAGTKDVNMLQLDVNVKF